jgi:hypothetical protein
MKKIILLALLLNVSCHLFAFTSQGVWRWRADNGSETSATWLADQNTPLIIYGTDSILRLRIEMYNDSVGSDGTLTQVTLQDSTNEEGSGWSQIRLDTGSNAFVLAGASPNVTDLEPTTQQLSLRTGFTFDPGYEIVSSELYPNQLVDTMHSTEIEYAIKPTSLIKTGVNYYFRVNSAYYPAGYIYPSLSLNAGILPVTMTAFNVAADKDRVKVNWSTATEENCSHFDIERSTDGFRFSTIATVKGNGTSSIAHNYTIYDESPVNGMNYYRIKQYDTDGKFAVSGVKSVNILMQNATTRVYPNPSHGDVNLILQSYTGKVTATLLTIDGKAAHQEVIQAIAGQSNYKLNLSTHLAPGIYILQLKGTSLSESIKILVQ